MLKMAYRRIIYEGQGDNALKKRIIEIATRNEEIINFTIVTIEGDKKNE